MWTFRWSTRLSFFVLLRKSNPQNRINLKTAAEISVLGCRKIQYLLAFSTASLSVKEALCKNQHLKKYLLVPLLKVL